MPLSLSIQEGYPPHLLAQKLNNRAAHCIEIGKYNDAIPVLLKTLKLSESVAKDCVDEESDMDLEDERIGCSCERCSLDYCFTYSQQDLARRVTPSLDEKSSSTGGYIYRNPIRVDQVSIDECHDMGMVLPLMLTFNLALANHLSALQDDTINRRKMQKVLRLYELAYRWQMEQMDPQIQCLRFALVIANNLGEIHRAVSNHDKHQKCLEHLLSTLMFLIDCNQVERETIDVDGFLRNTSGLILHSHCAGAA